MAAATKMTAAIIIPATLLLLLVASNMVTPTMALHRTHGASMCATNVTHMRGFNINLLRGSWYTDAAGDPQTGISCATVRFSNIDNAGLLVVQKLFKFDNLATPVEFDAANFFDPVDPSTFIGSYSYAEDEKPSIVDTTVIDTDYVNYLLIHACGYTVHDDPIEGYGILTRSPVGLAEARRAALYAKLYKSLGNRGALYVTRRDGCESVAKDMLIASTSAPDPSGVMATAESSNPFKRALKYLITPK